MALTVPKAGIIAGRAPDMASARVPQSNLGGVMSDFGARMAEVGIQLNNERLDREMTRLKTGMTQDLGNLRLQVEDMGDPDQAGKAWDSGVAQIRSTYMDGQNDDGSPKVDPALRSDFGLAYDDLAASHGLAIGGRLLSLRRDQRNAQYYDYSNTVVQQAAAADPGTQGTLFGELDSTIDKAVARGDMTAEQGARAKHEARQTTDNTTAIDMLQNNPGGLIDQLSAGGLSNLDPETRERYRVSALSEIQRRDAAARKQAEVDDRELSTRVGQRLDDVADLADRGLKSADGIWIHSQQVQDLAARNPAIAEKLGRAQAASDLLRDRPGIQQATPDQLNAMIAEERARPHAQPYEAKRVELLQDAHDKAVTGWTSDPIGYAGKIGINVPGVDFTDVANLPSAIAARTTFGGWLHDQGYTRDAAAPLTKDEQIQLGKTLDAVQDPTERAALAGKIAASVSQRGGKIDDIQAFSTKGPMGWVAPGIAFGSLSPALGGEILRGQAAIDAGNLILPPVADRLGPTFTMLNDMFAGIPGGEERERQVIGAADALYAARRRTANPKSAIDDDIYKQALHEVMGGSGTYGTSSQRGGVQNVKGRKTFLDEGVRARDVETAIAALTRDMNAGAKGPHNIDTAPRVAHANQAIAGLSNGAEPGINGKPLSRADWQNATFEQIRPDEYAIILPYGGGVQVTDMHGAPYTFKMSRLLSAYRSGGQR